MSNYSDEIKRLIDEEHRNRCLSYLSVADDLLGVEVRPLTLRMKVDLYLAGNGFITGRMVDRSHVFDLLWRLSPHYARPVHPNVLGRRTRGPIQRFLLLWLAFGSRSTAARFLELERHVARLGLITAITAIHERLDRWHQDRPVAFTSDKPASLLPKADHHWIDAFVAYFLRHTAMSIDTVLDTPISILYQIHRDRTIAAGGEVIDPNAAKIQQLIMAHSAATPANGSR